MPGFVNKIQKFGFYEGGDLFFMTLWVPINTSRRITSHVVVVVVVVE